MNTLKENIFKLYEFSDLLIENGMQEEADRMIADIDAIAAKPTKENIFKLYEFSDLLIENGMQDDADRLIADIDAILKSLKEQ